MHTAHSRRPQVRGDRSSSVEVPHEEDGNVDTKTVDKVQLKAFVGAGTERG